jgi:hypothetical protein
VPSFLEKKANALVGDRFLREMLIWINHEDALIERMSDKANRLDR